MSAFVSAVVFLAITLSWATRAGSRLLSVFICYGLSQECGCAWLLAGGFSGLQHVLHVC